MSSFCLSKVSLYAFKSANFFLSCSKAICLSTAIISSFTLSNVWSRPTSRRNVRNSANKASISFARSVKSAIGYTSFSPGFFSNSRSYAFIMSKRRSKSLRTRVASIVFSRNNNCVANNSDFEISSVFHRSNCGANVVFK